MSPTRFVSVALATLALAAHAAGAPKGVEVADIDRAADPCTDFYAFANGAWRAANPIPAGMQRWSRRFASRAANRVQLEALLQELAKQADRPKGSIEQQLGDHFAACLNEPAVDAAGVTPLQPLLTDIAGVKDVAGVLRMVRRLHELSVPALFALTAASDYQDPANMIVNVAAGSLGLPDRDHYLKSEPRFLEAREKYRAHVAALLALGGAPTAAARQAAEDILALETRLAEASLDAATAADPARTSHKRPFAQLPARLDWETYFREAGLPRGEVNVAEPELLERLSRELETTPVEVWKAYLTLQLLESASPWLGKPFADEVFAFKDKYLGGASAMKPREIRCLDSTEALLGEALGRKYAERYFPPAAKAKVQELVHALLEVLQEEVGDLTWMAPATRHQALAKLRSYDVKVGYPDAWTDTSTLAIRRDALWANVAAARRFGVDLNRRRAGQRVSHEVWQLPPSSPDAYIDIQLNQIVLPAGFLQAPAFDLGATDAANYGAIGVGVAHDLTHAIDLLGADFDATGQPRNWWSEPDRQAFQQLGQCVVDQYDGYLIEPGVHNQGKQVRGEAIGDLAGVRVAYLALQRSLERQPVPTIDGFSAEQQFFISLGQYRGAAESLELQRQMVKSDGHATAKYRVIGPIAGSPEFQRAFACRPGSAMVKARRCSVW